MSNHCTDNAADRKIGEFWERKFCTLAGQNGKAFTPFQIGHNGSAVAHEFREDHIHPHTLPDIAVWTAPGEFHEIKHKNPTKHNSIGLERYRFNALEWFWRQTQRGVYYTLHRWDLSPDGKDGAINRIEDWCSVSVATMKDVMATKDYKEFPGNSWVNGTKRKVDIGYWPVAIFSPLAHLWNLT